MKDVANVSFSNDKLRAVTDYFMKNASIAAANLPATAVDGVRLGNVLSRIEFVVEVGDTALNVAASQTLAVKVQKCSTKDGSFVDFQTIYSLAGAATKGAGVELARFTMPVVDDAFYKVVATSNAANSGTLTVYQHQIA